MPKPSSKLQGLLSSPGLMLGLACLSSLSACTAIQNTSELREGARYKTGDTASARVGDVMLDRYRYRTESIAQPLAAIAAAPGRLEVRTGSTLIGRKVDGELSFCTRLDGNFACFYDADNDGAFDRVKVVNVGIASSKQTLTPVARYTRSDASRSTGYQYQLLYQGRSDNVINLSYREYIDDLARPAYDQELHYTLQPGGVTEISFRAARLRVVKADNETIQYEVLSGLAEP